jgi:D-alanyl-D-alanine dipeptidase
MRRILWHYNTLFLMGVLLMIQASGFAESNNQSNRNKDSALLPTGFVYLHTVDPTIHQDIRYATKDNFVGRPIPSYRGSKCILTREAAESLALVQAELAKSELSLLVYDGYRPQQAVEYFVKWAEDLNDQIMKTEYYPNVNKKDIFDLGYIDAKSSHTHGSTVDLTIINAKTGEPLDMGSHFDLFDPISHPYNANVTQEQYNHRQYLRSLMKRYGFKGILTEWWHFTLSDEPFKETAYNFDVVDPV